MENRERMAAPSQLNEVSISVECKRHSYRKVGGMAALRILQKGKILVTFSLIATYQLAPFWRSFRVKPHSFQKKRFSVGVAQKKS